MSDQTNNTVPPPSNNPVIEDLKVQKEIAELRKAIAEAQKAEREAQFPKGESKPLEGKTTTDDKTSGVAVAVGYHAMASCVNTICRAIAKTLNSNQLQEKILLVDSLSFAHGEYPLHQVSSGLTLFEGEFELQKQQFDKLLAPESETAPSKTFGVEGLGAGLAAVGGVISLVTDIVGFFRANYDIKGQEFTLSDEALRISAAGNLRGFSVYLFNFNLVEGSEIFKRLMALMALKTSLTTQKEQVEKRYKDAEQKSKADDAINEWQRRNAAFDTFVTSISAAPSAETPAPLVIAAAREFIRTQGITHLLYLKVVASGGERITEQAQMRSGIVDVIGQCTVAYCLAEKSGEVVLGDTLTRLFVLQYALGKPKETSLDPIDSDHLNGK